MKKILYILRHAKAETGGPNQDDHERALNAQGVEACEAMGKYMIRHGVRPELVLCSTAERASETWERIQGVYMPPPKLEYSERLYLASANEILGVIGEVADGVERLMVVGHNPGLHQLAMKLAAKGDERLLDELALKFPTCALAAIDLGETSWDMARHTQGELQAFVTPSKLHAVIQLTLI